MPIYIALLRGINLGAHNRIRMEPLRESCAALGLIKVETYLQSGNIVFRASDKSAAKLSKKLEEKILNDFGLTVPVISITAAELNDTVQNNPFMKEPAIDISRLHVTFLESEPALPATKKLETLTGVPDRFHHSSKLIYLHTPDGYGNTKLSNNAFERLLAVRATTRNWKTVSSLHQMTLGQS